MRHWIALILLVLATVAYYYQTQFVKPKTPVPVATPVPTPLPPGAVEPAVLEKLRAFTAQLKLRSTILGPPDIAIIDGREVVEGARLPAGPGLEVEVRDVGDGFVVLGHKSETFRIETAAAPSPSPRR